jgi:hypothetical protein
MVIKACVILHNLIIDFERINNIDSNYKAAMDYIPSHPFTWWIKKYIIKPDDRISMIPEVYDVNQHNYCQHNLMEVLWERWNTMNEGHDGSNDSE